jgi:polyhydroxyalkanoate synthase
MTLPESPEDFLAGATQNAGSWWTHWNQWVTSLPGGSAKVKARKPEDGTLKVIEDAPGSYVKFRLDTQKKAELICRNNAKGRLRPPFFSN